MRQFVCECLNCGLKKTRQFKEEPYPEYGEVFVAHCKVCDSDQNHTRVLTRKTQAELRRRQEEEDLKKSISDQCARHGFTCRFLYQSVIITTPLADWCFDYHEKYKTLRRFTSRGDATFHFFYDYGDGWEVVLRLEEVFEDSELPGKELPRVLEGQGFGIIEDCGGPAGLEHLREVFQQKSSPEYQSMREWLGTSEVDLSVFDLQDLNFRLKKLPRIFRDLYEYDYPPTKHSIDLLDRKYCKTN